MVLSMVVPDYTLLDRADIASRMFHLDSDGIPSMFGRWDPLPDGASSHLVTESGIALACRFFLQAKASPVILFFHGNGEVASDYNNLYPHMYEHGINLFAAEYRGYSSSYGTPTYSRMLSDAHHVYRYFREYLERQSFTGKVFVMGRSLGAAPALELAAYYQDYFDGVIIESGSGGSKGWDRWFQGSMDRSTLVSLQVSHAAKLKRIHLPLLSIHGELDSTVSVESAWELQDMVSSKVKEIAIISNAGHNTIFLRGMSQYMDALGSFIAAV
jgi:alpha-beta hydrolase superfamily lysophospholipase